MEERKRNTILDSWRRGYSSSSSPIGYGKCLFGMGGVRRKKIEKNYPFTGMHGPCDLTKVKEPIVKMADFAKHFFTKERQMLHAVCKQPLLAGVHASKAFSLYKGGIFRNDCPGTLNHLVLVVGYLRDLRGRSIG